MGLSLELQERNPIRPMLKWTRIAIFRLTTSFREGIKPYVRGTSVLQSALNAKLSEPFSCCSRQFSNYMNTTQAIQWSLILRVRWREALSKTYSTICCSMIAIHVWLTWKFSAGHQPEENPFHRISLTYPDECQLEYEYALLCASMYRQENSVSAYYRLNITRKRFKHIWLLRTECPDISWVHSVTCSLKPDGVEPTYLPTGVHTWLVT
jgi:hypothetical protein